LCWEGHRVVPGHQQQEGTKNTSLTVQIECFLKGPVHTKGGRRHHQHKRSQMKKGTEARTESPRSKCCTTRRHGSAQGSVLFQRRSCAGADHASHPRQTRPSNPPLFASPMPHSSVPSASPVGVCACPQEKLAACAQAAAKRSTMTLAQSRADANAAAITAEWRTPPL
jgi:hypothetical protein